MKINAFHTMSNNLHVTFLALIFILILVLSFLFFIFLRFKIFFSKIKEKLAWKEYQFHN